MASHDVNEEAARQVQKLTGSPSVNGEDLLKSPKLKRKYREMKEQLAKLGPLPLPLKPARKKPVK